MRVSVSLALISHLATLAQIQNAVVIRDDDTGENHHMMRNLRNVTSYAQSVSYVQLYFTTRYVRSVYCSRLFSVDSQTSM